MKASPRNAASARDGALGGQVTGRGHGDSRIVTERWAAAVVRRGRAHGDVVRYGTEAWHQLPASDPRKLAGLVIAAECWRIDGQPDRVLQRHLDALAAACSVVEAEAAASWAQVADHVRNYGTAPRR